MASPSYSGRGMYGKTCAAITFGDLQESFRFFASLGEQTAMNAEDTDDIASAQLFNLVGDAQADGMGRDIVAYFPGWTFA
jgi:hypothetical protein